MKAMGRSSVVVAAAGAVRTAASLAKNFGVKLKRMPDCIDRY